MLEVTPKNAPCGAVVTGVDLSKPLAGDEVDAIRRAWLDHHVLVFPDQSMDDDDLERFTLYFGAFGDDPFFGSIDGHPHIAAIERRADETTPLFAEGWHTDWSFQEQPPIGTCLLAIEIPPHGGDTLFANQHLAYEQMPADLKARVDGLTAIHSAEVAYAPDGLYGDKDGQEADRGMQIIVSEDARNKQRHPFVRPHSETGRPALFSTAGYIQGFEGLEPDENRRLLAALYAYQSDERFIYRHEWADGMLVMWDNRSVLHRATGGYDGHRRLLHRTTIAARDGERLERTI